MLYIINPIDRIKANGCAAPVEVTTLGPAQEPQVVEEKNKTVQCKGITKKGTRCKHYTHIANGYCFQHQPG